jgi:LysM repeat protein
MSYRIQSGDTLWALARKNGTTIAALMKSNPQIKNANLIYAGAQLNIPGRGDSFDPGPRPGGSAPTGQTQGPGQVQGPGHTGPASSAFNIAKAQLGKNAGSLKLENSALGRAMENWVPNNVNCASFVAGCLEAAGQIGHNDYSASCMTLQAKLDRNSNFQRVSLANASPGDCVTFKTSGGHHTVMFAGWSNGKPQFIGSNNVNADGTQKITMGNMNYQLLSVHHYKG